MHFLISSIIEIFHSSRNPAAQLIAEKLGHVPNHGFTQKFPPMPAVERLSTTLLMPNAHAFTADINAVANYLPWGRLATHSPTGMTAPGRIFCQLAGPEGPIEDDSFRLGVYFQSPDTFYPSHWHNAEEVYFILSGTALWQKKKAPFVLQKPGSLIHHLPNQPHAMQTKKEPLLALWGWVGDIGFESYRIE